VGDSRLTRSSERAGRGNDANVIEPLLEACAAVCKDCGDECQRHSQMHQHSQVCAEACRSCEHACRELLNAIK